jgi:hypothetical protein
MWKINVIILGKTQNKSYLNENKYIDKGPTLACFYSSMGLNRELNGDVQSALKYFLLAIDEWKSLGENGFVLICINNIFNISKSTNVDPNLMQSIHSLYNQILKSPEYQDVNKDFLFEGFESKILYAKQVINSKFFNNS